MFLGSGGVVEAALNLAQKKTESWRDRIGLKPKNT
jgi:hypothetical protein